MLYYNDKKIFFFSRISFDIFKVDRNGCHTEDLSGDTEDDSGSPVHAAVNWTLPSKDFQGQWETLIYDTDVKKSLLSYVEATMLLSEKEVDPALCSWNRVVLLHGPPGTGNNILSIPSLMALLPKCS